MESITIYPPKNLLMKWQKIASIKGITVEELIVSTVQEIHSRWENRCGLLLKLGF